MARFLVTMDAKPVIAVEVESKDEAYAAACEKMYSNPWVANWYAIAGTIDICEVPTEERT